MFERFTQDARASVERAVHAAQDRGAAQIGSEDLLTSLATGPEGAARRALTRCGLTDTVLAQVRSELDRTRRRGGLTDTDVSALADLGIDVDAVVSQIESAYGDAALDPSAAGSRRGGVALRRLPLARDARELLRRSLSEARDLGDRHLGEEHLLLALVGARTPVSEALAAHAVTYPAVRAALAHPA